MLKKVSLRSITVQDAAVHVQAAVSGDGGDFMSGFVFDIKDNEDVKEAAMKFDAVIREKVMTTLGIASAAEAGKVS